MTLKTHHGLFITVQQAHAQRIKITQFVWFMHRIILCGSMIFHFMGHNFFYKFVGKDLGLLNIKSFKFRQYSLQAKIFGFHRCLIAEILNIFCIIPYVRMIMALSEQLIGSTRPYMVLIIILCNDLLEKNNLSQRICMCSCTSRFSSSFVSLIRWFILFFSVLKRFETS